MILLDGKKIKDKILKEIKIRLEEIDKKLKIVVIQIGNDEASNIYISQKRKMFLELNIEFEHINLSNDTNEENIIDLIDKLNNDNNVDGIMIQLPVPKRIDIRKVIDKIHPNKDVDGLTNINKDKLINDIDCLIPCTALGIIDLLKEYKIEIKNKNIVVVGRSELVGKPVSILLEKEGGNITICHSKTENLSTYTKNADILISAVGKSKLITKEMVKEGVVVIDVGINKIDNKITGDVDFEPVSKKASYITPVPGGVGPMTLASLSKNLLKAYNLNKKVN